MDKSSYSTRASLIFRLKDLRDDDSWQQFCDHYRPYIFTISSRMGVQAADLDDVIQQVLIQTWKALPDFNYDIAVGGFKNWLAQISRNTVLAHLRTQRRVNDKHLQYGEDFQFENEDKYQDFADKYWKITLGEMAWKNIKDDFNRESQDIFDLLSQGFKNSAISERLDMKANRIAVSKKRLISALRREIIRLDSYLG